MLSDQLQNMLQEAAEASSTATTIAKLEQVRVEFLGKNGQVTEHLKSIGKLPADQRKSVGQLINEIKDKITELLEMRRKTLQEQELHQALNTAKIDVTLPGRGQLIGALHPVTLTAQRIEQIITKMGFAVAQGPEIEDDYHNFAALNIPESHPARAMQDTFYLPGELLLRTHTSPVQIRVMESHQPPLRIITPGRVYRRDFDLTHTPMFNQLEILAIDKNINFADLKGTLINFLKQFFNENIAVRFRPSYFPFTEPSAEVDISCTNCDAKGCRVCKNSGWLEVLGCGMVHPNVFNNLGIDNEIYTGFAAGMGLDRLAMLRYQINDLRLMFENDVRFLQQFVN